MAIGEGAPWVAAICEPDSTMRMSEVGSLANTTGLPASVGKVFSAPAPLLAWQALQLFR